MTWIGVSSHAYGRVRVISSCSTTPKLQTSHFSENFSPFSTSGAA